MSDETARVLTTLYHQLPQLDRRRRRAKNPMIFALARALGHRFSNDEAKALLASLRARPVRVSLSARSSPTRGRARVTTFCSGCGADRPIASESEDELLCAECTRKRYLPPGFLERVVYVDIDRAPMPKGPAPPITLTQAS